MILKILTSASHMQLDIELYKNFDTQVKKTQEKAIHACVDAFFFVLCVCIRVTRKSIQKQIKKFL